MASFDPNQEADLKETENTWKESKLSMMQQPSSVIVNWKHIAHCMKHEMFPKIGQHAMTIIEQMSSEKVNDLSPEVVEEVISELQRVRGRNFIYNHEVFIHEMVNRARTFNAIATCAASDSLVFCSRQSCK